MAKTTATRSEYDAAFAVESVSRYEVIVELEASLGYAVDHEWLLNAARVLACPVKTNPPNWQHGRVVYAALRRYLEGSDEGRSSASPVRCLDIGTAKGFSAICMARAMLDAERFGHVTSVDVIDPEERTRRNTVAEVDGLLTLREIVKPWGEETKLIEFVSGRGENWLLLNRKRVHFAFVDGKHTYDAVSRELRGLAGCQRAGDVVVCDDTHVPGVEKAVHEADKDYSRHDVPLLENRSYAMLMRR